MGGVYNLLNYDKAPGKTFSRKKGGFIRRAAIETWGREREGGVSDLFNSKKKTMSTAFYRAAMGEKGLKLDDSNPNEENFKPLDHEKNQSILVWWKYLNPVKWLEFLACVIRRGAEEASLVFTKDQANKLTYKQPGTIFLHGLSNIVTAGYDVLRWFTSPFNQVWRPLWFSLRSLWKRPDHEVGKLRAALVVVAILAVTAFIVASIATGGTLPFLTAVSAALYSAIPAVAAWWGTSTLLAGVVLGYSFVLAGVALTQRLFSDFLPFWKDIASGALGFGGYNSKREIISTLTRETVDRPVVPGEIRLREKILKGPPDDPSRVEIDFKHSDSTHSESYADAFWMFGRDMSAPMTITCTEEVEVSARDQGSVEEKDATTPAGVRVLERHETITFHGDDEEPSGEWAVGVETKTRVFTRKNKAEFFAPIMQANGQANGHANSDRAGDEQKLLGRPERINAFEVKMEDPEQNSFGTSYGLGHVAKLT